MTDEEIMNAFVEDNIPVPPINGNKGKKSQGKQRGALFTKLASLSVGQSVLLNMSPNRVRGKVSQMRTFTKLDFVVRTKNGKIRVWRTA